MLSFRLIPIILIEEGRMVKTTKFKNPKYIGDPINAVRIFNEKLVDEIFLVDMSVSNINSNPNFNVIENIASECFMPLSYSGGIKSFDHVKTIFSLGVEKISFQSIVFQNNDVIKKTISSYGSQSVVVSLDVKKDWFGNYKLFDHLKNKSRSGNLFEHIKEISALGVGEIIINCVDKDGTLTGPDLNLVNNISKLVDIPLIYNGGISSVSDIKNVFNFGVSVLAGAFFVYHGPHRAVLITYPNQCELKMNLN